MTAAPISGQTFIDNCNRKGGSTSKIARKGEWVGGRGHTGEWVGRRV